jgi:Flp pilus assembly protein TadD
LASSKIVLTSLAACWLLAGCATKPVDGQDHALSVSSRLHLADAAEASGDKQTAVSMYLAAANDAPADSAIQLRCAEGLARNGRLEDAEGLVVRRLKSAPKDMDLLRTLGAIQVMTGKPQDALQTLSGVLASKPDDVSALTDKAVALDILRRHDEAQALYRQALGLSPQDATISNDFALSLLLSGQAAAGAQVLAPFRERLGLPERIRTNLGIMDAASGRAEDAHALLGTHIEPADLAKLTEAINRGAPGQPRGIGTN